MRQYIKKCLYAKTFNVQGEIALSHLYPRG